MNQETPEFLENELVRSANVSDDKYNDCKLQIVPLNNAKTAALNEDVTVNLPAEYQASFFNCTKSSDCTLRNFNVECPDGTSEKDGVCLQPNSCGDITVEQSSSAGADQSTTDLPKSLSHDHLYETVSPVGQSANSMCLG